MVMAAGRRKSHRQRLFVWQAALILLPVMVLVLVGLSFLRQDRLLARREAEQRAQEIADELLPRCASALLATNDLTVPPPHILRLSREGVLVSPPPIPALTPLSLDVSRLDSQQLNWCRQMQGFEQSRSVLDEQLEAARNLAASNLPDSFMPIALYWVGALEQNLGNTGEAARDFEHLVQQFPRAKGETGLPLAPLATLKLVEIKASSTDQRLSTGGMMAADLCSNIVSNPSQVSESILEAVSRVAPRAERAAVERWLMQWEVDQGGRQLYHALHEQLRAPKIGAPFWFQLEEPLTTAKADGEFSQRWLAFCPKPEVVTNSIERDPSERAVVTPAALVNAIPANAASHTNRAVAPSDSHTNVSVYVYSETELLKREMIYITPLKVPPYMGVAVQVAGRDLVSPFLPSRHLWREVGYIGRNGGGVKKEVLPELATELLASAGGDFLHVNVYLTSPSDLFKRQRTRTFWLSSVIATSFLAAIAGLLAAWRSFSRQEQLAEMKTNFVSSVSHELRAPIASVRLLAESLERGNVSTPDKQTQYYHFIGQECRRLSSLIENVLDFSRIEQGRKQYEFDPTDLLALVRQTVALMNPYARERDVSLVCDVDGSVHERLEISIDGQAIQQALINLIDNALKHSTIGREVKVGLAVGSNTGKTNEDERSTIDIYVEDQGAGIPEAEHEKIFERFYRLGSELRRETQGIGIGLSIVKHIVEGHDGRVIVRSSPGTGSRFTIELPLVSTERC
jgi:signal transduction histidine kinase